MSDMQAGLLPERTAQEIYEDYLKSLIQACKKLLHAYETDVPLNIGSVEHFADRASFWGGQRYLDEAEDPKPTYQNYNLRRS